MALSKDVHIERYGVGGNAHQLLNMPLGAGVTVFRGSFALTDANGNLKNASNPSSTDKAWGLVLQAGPESIDSGPGIINSSTTAGVVTVDIATGTFFMASDGTLAQSSVGLTVYLKDEVTVSLTQASRPVAGTLVYIETRAQAPGNYAIEIGSAITGPIGGP